MLEFEWDAKKAALNLRKHDVAFEEARTVFRDPMAASDSDPDHSLAEDRYLTFGVSATGRMLAVAHTYRNGKIRIISARLATRMERKLYEES
jgi:uncharacterized DUF497 family protein